MIEKIEGKILVDTNILIYAHYDSRDNKYGKASNIILDFGRSGKGVLSIQTLTESYWVMVYKRKPGLSPELAKQILTDYAQTWVVLEPTKHTFIKAMEGVVKYKMSFWDSMQWGISVENNITAIITEDFNHGQVVEGVKFFNPFKE